AQRVVAAEPVSVPMKMVGPAAGDDVDDRPGVTSVFRVEVIADDPEFLPRMGIDGHNAAGTAGDAGVVVVDAVEHEIVVAASGAVHRKSRRGIVGLDR